MAETVAPQQQSEDERRLAELGDTQALQRSWSSFSNFAISFTIISVLAGCFTTYGQAWNNGGPIAISWGWPIICGLVLLVAFSMAELVSAYPTAGGIYYWASTLGGPRWGWFTGWFNWVGVVGVVASGGYGCGPVPQPDAPLLLAHPRVRELRRLGARAVGDVLPVHLHPHAARADQHLLVAAGGALQQHQR